MPPSCGSTKPMGLPRWGSPSRVAETRARASLLGEARPSCLTAQQRRGGAGETVLVCKGTWGWMGPPRGVMLSAVVRFARPSASLQQSSAVRRVACMMELGVGVGSGDAS